MRFCLLVIFCLCVGCSSDPKNGNHPPPGGDSSSYDLWFGVGGSDFGRWSSMITWPQAGSGGGISDSTGASGNPRLKLDSLGRPIVAWHDDTTGLSQIWVRRFDGVTWKDVGSASPSGDYATDPTLALDDSDRPVIAWHKSAEVHVKGLDGADWSELNGSASGGGISNNGFSSIHPSLVLDGDGNPVVVWQDSSAGDFDVYVKGYDGAFWWEVGTGATAAGGISNSTMRADSPVVAVDTTDRLVVAWHDRNSGQYEIYVRRFDGVDWLELGAGSAAGAGISNSGVDARDPSLVLDAQNNPIIAWRDEKSGTGEIYIKRFNGITWEEVGVGSASGTGVSASPGDARNPSLGLDSSGNPVVAWWEDLSASDQILVRRFNGSSWTGAVSISNSANDSHWPSLATGQELICVAWGEANDVAEQIVMRCAYE